MKKALGLLGFAALGSLAFAEGTTGTSGSGLIAIGMGLAIGLGALGTGVAQSAIGAAALGSVVEDRKNFGTALIFFLIPETLVIFGLLGYFLLMGKV